MMPRIIDYTMKDVILAIHDTVTKHGVSEVWTGSKQACLNLRRKVQLKFQFGIKLHTKSQIQFSRIDEQPQLQVFSYVQRFWTSETVAMDIVKDYSGIWTGPVANLSTLLQTLAKHGIRPLALVDITKPLAIRFVKE